MKILHSFSNWVWGAAGLSCLVIGIATNGVAEAPLEVSAVIKTDKAIDFNRDVKPILSENCFVCHGPDAAAVAAGLRLDLFEEATAERGGRPAIFPGSPEKSVLFQRIDTDITPLRMPPVSSGKEALTSEQIDILKRWVESGAEYSPHWSYVPPVNPEVPSSSFDSWARTPIDSFIAARLEEEGLKPSAQANKETLIRRVYLTMIGLPPSQQAVSDFLTDDSVDAYEKVVDGLLANPKYGEHQARYWLDAVRYGDTHGLHLDNERSVWPYRDWVVRAMNADMPFNDFATWQLAGDLLPNPTSEQLIATGYVRMNLTTSEGGVIVEEVQAMNSFDRTETTSTVFLGSTMTCARCHDHKFDPITHKDYYSMFAFFNSTSDNPLDGNAMLPGPVVKAPTPAQAKRVEQLGRIKDGIANRTNLEDAQKWAAELATKYPTLGSWEISQAFGAKDVNEAYDKNFGAEPGGVTTAVEWKPFDYKLGDVRQSIIKKDNAAIYVRTTINAPVKQDLDLRLGSDDAIKVWVDDKVIHQNKAARGVAADQDKVTATLEQGSHTILIKIANGGGADGIYFNYGSPTIERAVILSKTGLSSAAARELRGLYLLNESDSDEAKFYKQFDSEQKALDAVIPSTLVAKELDKLRDTHILRRGVYDQKLEKVDRAIPAMFGSLPSNAPVNRLGLAQWLTDPNHPLVSRVLVNRVWQRHFGTGIVRTSEDFGSQGDWPSHPVLLDYLAKSFVDNGWSMKALHKQIVMSATFQQSAVVSSEAAVKDPQNRLLSRGPRFRLDAEVVRDQALYLSGLLVEKIGGKGVNTYQPSGLWEAVGYTRSNTANYTQGTGEDLYRRSLYTFWKRTSPPATLAIFDAPSREACSVRRSRTNTPMQALATMNDPQFVEAARKLAEKVMSSSDVVDSRAAWLFKVATGRAATPTEVALISKSYSKQLELLQENAAGVDGILKTGESPVDDSLDRTDLAAWTMICNLVLNLDEVLTQH